MARLQQLAASTAACWLVLAVFLAAQPQRVGAGAAPLWPLALHFQGRTYELDGGSGLLELPLSCGQGASDFGIQHRVPAVRLQHQCVGTLTFLTADTSRQATGVWTGDQAAPATVMGADSQHQGDAEQPVSLLFRFEVPAAVFQPGLEYKLQLAVYCSGRDSNPTLQSALSFRSAACTDGDKQPRHAVQHVQRVQADVQRVQADAAQAGLTLPSSGGAEAAAPQHLQRAARQLAQADGSSVAVVLLPSSSGDATLVDGYSGLARNISDSQAALPCGSDGKSADGSSRCLSDPLVRTSSARIKLTLQLAGSSGAKLSGQVAPQAFTVKGGAVSEVPVVVGGGSAVEVTVSLDGGATCTVVVAQGALAANGVNNAASNMLAIDLDTSRPVPVITTPGNVGVTSDTQIAFSIEFGEQVLASDPFSLFSYSGAARLDAVLEVAAGRLDVAVYVLPQSQGEEADITLWVPSGTVSDLVGNRNNVSDALTVKYRPESSGLEAAGVAANVLLGTSLALCTSASYLTSHYLPFSTAVLGCGSLSFLGWAQTFFLTSKLAAQWMPEGYRQVAGTFVWTLGDLGVIWADSIPDMDPDLAFPWAPVALTSTGQEVATGQYPSVRPASLTPNMPVVAVTGELSALQKDGQPVPVVLDGVPFLNPQQAQLVGAPPAATAAAAEAGSQPAPEASPAPDPATAGGNPQSEQDVALPPLIVSTPGTAGGARKLRRAPALPVESTSQRRRRLHADSLRGRRAMLQAVGSAAPAAAQPAFDGTLYVVASRGLQLMSPDGVANLTDVLVGGGAVQRALDVIDSAGEDGAYPRQYYYDCLARTAFWTALAAFLVMALHLTALGCMMWRHARVPNAMWFPRIELVVCLAILPGLSYGCAAMFNGNGGDIALGVVLLLLLPASFLLASFYLLFRWLQHPTLNTRRAVFILRSDPLAAQIAMQTPTATPGATPRGELPTPLNGVAPRNGGDSAAGDYRDDRSLDGKAGSGLAAAGKTGVAGSVVTELDSPGGSSTGAKPQLAAGMSPQAAAEMAAANARRWSFTGFVRSLCGSRKLQGDWCGINLDSRFTFKYGPLFETTFGQALARRRATYQFDPLRGKMDRGALVPLPELPTISWRGRALVEPHHLRTPAQLLGVTKTLILAAAVSGIACVDSYIQCCLLILLYGFYGIYLLAVRPFNVALVGGFELVTTLCALSTTGLAMAVMGGRGSSDFTRSLVGTVMLILQLIAFLAFLGGTWAVALRAIWGATGLRRRLRLKPSPSDRFAEVVLQVMARDPHILARKFVDRWMVNALGVGLFDRPVWRRETEDLRRLLRATTLPKRRVAQMGSVVRRKSAAASSVPPEVRGSSQGGSTPPGSSSGRFGSGSDRGSEPRFVMPAAAHPSPAVSERDTAIAVPSTRRPPPRELAAQPGSELHRQLSETSLPAPAQQQQPQHESELEPEAEHQHWL